MVCLLFSPSLLCAADNNWVGTDGWWDDIANWSLGAQPADGDDVYLTQSDATNRNVYYFNDLDPSPTLKSLTVDATGLGTITLNQGYGGYSHPLSALNEYVGYHGTGTFTQTAATNTADGLFIGGLPGGNGTYNLGAGSLSAYHTGVEYTDVYEDVPIYDPDGTLMGYNHVFIGTRTNTIAYGMESVGGSGGTGAFTQTGGTNVAAELYVGGDLWSAERAGGTGTYNLSGGSLSAHHEVENIDEYGQTYSCAVGIEYVGTHGGVGTFIQTGGTNAAAWLSIGAGGTGTFTQTGGTNTVGSLGVGTGTYDLSDGSLSAGGEIIGGGGAGTSTFTQTGGTNTAEWLGVGVDAGSTGIYNLSAGSLTAGEESIGGYLATGTFTQTGGTNAVVGSLEVGGSGGTGVYDLSAGNLSVFMYEHIGRGDYLASSRTGTFTQTGGTNTAYGLILGEGSGSSGTYNLSDGNLSALKQFIGGAPSWWSAGGTGTFTQTGGTNTTGTLTIKANPTATGVYNLDGGTLTATAIVNNDRFNYSGGNLNGNFTNNPGAIFTLSGPGTRTVNGNVVNYGVLRTDPVKVEFLGNLTIEPGGSIQAAAGDEYVLYKDFIINSDSTAGWTTSAADLMFTGAGSHFFSFSGLDLTWNELFLDSGVTLNFSDTGSFRAVVLSGLAFNLDGTIANIWAPDGFTLFYDPSQYPELSGISQLSGGGTLSPVPLPGAVWLGLLGLIVARRRLKASGEWLSGGTLA